MTTYESSSEVDTFELAKKISQKAKKGEIYCLDGDLGAGKTHFAKGFAFGLGVEREITSPTFTIMNIYEADIPFYHFDVYRLSGFQEMEAIGYEEYFFGEGICLIEWSEIIKEIIPNSAVKITIKKNFEKGENYRLIEVN